MAEEIGSGAALGSVLLAVVLLSSVPATVAAGADAADTTLAVTIDGTNSPVTEGDRLAVSVTVENTGRDAVTETVTLTVGGEQRDATTVELGGGETKTVELTWATGDGDAGNYTATVASPNDSDTTDVSVREPTNFAVSIDGTNSPVTEGDRMEVTATVENTGGQTASQNVTLSVGGEVQDRTDVRLAGGETKTVELTWATGDGDAGNYTAEVASPDDSDTTDVSVREPANFAVSIDGTNSPVTEGDDLSVTATVENTGDRAASQNVTLSVGTARADSTDVSLDAGERTEVTLTWTTGPGDAGNYTAQITSEDDTVRRDVRVNAPPEVSVGGVETNSPVTEGETMEFTATVTNTGDTQETRTVALTVAGERRDATEVTLAGGESTTVELTWSTGQGDAGNYTASLSSPNDTAERAVVVQEGASFDVRDLELPSQVTAGEQFTVSAVVENTGEYAGETEVDLVSSKGEPFDYDAKTVSLSPGESTTVDVVVETQRGDAGTYTIGLVAGNGSYDDVNETPGDSSATGTVVVNAPPTVQALEFVPCDPDCDGDPVTVSLGGTKYNNVQMTRGAKQNATMVEPDVSDDGEIVSYAWRIDGEPVGSGPSLKYSFAENRAYEVALTVTDDEGASTTVRVNVTVEGANEPPTVSIAGLHNVTVRDETTITPEASDPDGAITSYEWTVDGEVVSRSRTLAYTFEEPGEHEVAVQVTDDDGESTTETVTVTVEGTNEPPTVSIPSFSPTVGEEVTIEPEASDPDGAIASYTWRVDGEAVDTSRTFEYTFEEGGEHEVTVTVTDDQGASATARRTVTVEAPTTNDPPTVAIATELTNNTVRNDTATFRADASDPDGEIAGYEWVVDGEVVSESRTLEYTFEEPGEHEVTLRVTDDQGASTTASRTVEVTEPTATTEPADVDTPGFGPLVAVLALAGVALALRRR